MNPKPYPGPGLRGQITQLWLSVGQRMLLIRLDRQDSFKTWSWGRCHLRSPPREGGDTGPGPPEVPGVGPGPGPAHLLHLSAPSTQAGRWVREWLSHARQAPGCAQGRSICLKAESDAPHAGHCGQRSGECSGATRRTGSPRDSWSAPTESRGGPRTPRNPLHPQPLSHRLTWHRQD